MYQVFFTLLTGMRHWAGRYPTWADANRAAEALRESTDITSVSMEAV